MPMGAGILRWVLACRTIERKKRKLSYFIGKCRLPLRFLSSNILILMLMYKTIEDLTIVDETILEDIIPDKTILGKTY